MEDKRILIIGAGPTGIGAAFGLHERKYENWCIYERNSYWGGLSASFVDEKGFTWDVGGHILFSHYPYVDKLYDISIGDKKNTRVRESWIWVKNRFVPYPFQNNIRYLDVRDVQACIKDLQDANSKKLVSRNFEEWAKVTFGKRIAELFMLPYNFKVWAYPLKMMSKDWIGERVSVVDAKRIIENVKEGKDDVSWGPNSIFSFPLKGGTKAVYDGLISFFRDKLQLDKEIVKIDVEAKKVFFADGSSDHYDFLINTMPLDKFIRIAGLDKFYGDIGKLKHNSVFVVGVGVRGKCPSNKNWMYFPENNNPFYRVTYFSNYSQFNVPDGDYYSFLCETSYSEFKRENKSAIIKKTIQGLKNVKLLSDKEEIVDTYLIDVDYAYPIPTLERDEALRKIQPHLIEKGIFSRGRFGAWKYEIANMDHSVMMGAEAVDKILDNKDEAVWNL